MTNKRRDRVITASSFFAFITIRVKNKSFYEGKGKNKRHPLLAFILSKGEWSIKWPS